MKKWTLPIAVAVIALSMVAYVSAASKPEEATVIGEVIDLVSYAMKGERGEEHAEAGRYRCDLGFPVGILEEETGEVFVAVYRLPVPAAGLQTANKTLSPFMGKKVVVQGRKYQADGINVIRVAVVSEY